MKKICFLVLGLFILTFAWCSNSVETSESNKSEVTQKVIKIGVTKPLSGPMANYWADAVHAYELLVDDFNRKNNNLQVELIVEDDKGTPKDSTSAIQKLISIDAVDAVMWSSTSSAVMAAAPIAQENQTPYISSMASSRKISDIGNYVFRYRNDNDYIKKTVSYFEREGVKNVILLGAQTDFALSYRDNLKDYFSWHIEELFFPVEEKDYTLIAKQVKQKAHLGEYLIFMTLWDEAVIETMNALEKEGLLELFKNKIIVNEFLIKDTVIQALGNKIEGAKVSALGISLDVPQNWQDFLNLFKTKYEVQGSDYNIIMEAEAFKTLLKAFLIANSSNISVVESLAAFDKNNPENGLFGHYYFNEKGEAVGIQYDIQQFQNQKLIKID